MSRRHPSPLGLGLAIAITAGTAALSRVPYRAEPTDRAVLRLSWRYQRTSEEDCRRPTPAELEELPAHMRNPNACVRDPRSYALTLALDGAVVLQKTLEPAGARRDRPVVVYEEVTLSAGEHRVDVRFEEWAEGGDAPDRTLSWSRSLSIRPHEVVVIGYDRAEDALDRREPAVDTR